MYKLKINITKDILERSKMCNMGVGLPATTNCAIALAIRDIFPNAEVENEYILIYDKNDEANIIQLPKEATYFIKEFDDCTSEERLELPEFSFEIDISQEIIDTINIDEVREVLKDHKTLELIES